MDDIDESAHIVGSTVRPIIRSRPVGRQVFQACAKGNSCRKDCSSIPIPIPMLEGDHTSMGRLGHDICLDTAQGGGRER